MKEQPRFKATEGLATTLVTQGRKQRWLANQLGISDGQMSRVLSGEKTMPEELANKAASLLQVPFFLLFELTDVSNNVTMSSAA